VTEYAQDLVTITASYDDVVEKIEVRLNLAAIALDDITDLIRVLYRPGRDLSLGATQVLQPKTPATPPPDFFNRNGR